MCLSPSFEYVDLLGIRVELERRALAVQQCRTRRLDDRPELHDHRNTSRAREQGDVARGAAAKQCNTSAARPIDFQETGRWQILGADHRAAGNSRSRDRTAAQRPQHPVAQVHQIGRPRLQIFVGCGTVVRDLLVERGGPSRVRRRSGGNCGKDRIEEVFVVEQGHLKFENLRRLTARSVCQQGDLPARRFERRAQRELFILGRAGRALAARLRVDAHERPIGKADRCGPAPVCQPRDVCPHIH
jgi:hypothetical protein